MALGAVFQPYTRFPLQAILHAPAPTWHFVEVFWNADIKMWIVRWWCDGETY